MKVNHNWSDNPIVVREGTSIVVVPKALTGVFYLRFVGTDGTTHEIPINTITSIEPS